jgi:hypothetical protein
MRTSKNSVPLIPLKDFGPSPFLEDGIFIEEFEDCVSVRHKRMEVHRHDYVELFWLQGYGSVLIDFENYPLSGKSLIAIGPGRVHAWQVKKLTGLYIAFTQEFFDGTRPPPSPKISAFQTRARNSVTRGTGSPAKWCSCASV